MKNIENAPLNHVDLDRLLQTPSKLNLQNNQEEKGIVKLLSKEVQTKEKVKKPKRKKGETCVIKIITGKHGSDINKKPRGMIKLFKEVFTVAKLFGEYEIWTGKAMEGGAQHKGKIEISKIEPGRIYAKVQPKDNLLRREMIIHVREGEEESVKNAILEAQGMKAKEINICDENSLDGIINNTKWEIPKELEEYRHGEGRELVFCSIFQYESVLGFELTDEMIAMKLKDEYNLPCTIFDINHFIIEPLIEEELLVETHYLEENFDDNNGRLLEISQKARETFSNLEVKKVEIDIMTPGIKAITNLEKTVNQQSCYLSKLGELDTKISNLEEQIKALKHQKSLIIGFLSHPKYSEAKTKLRNVYQILDIQN